MRARLSALATAVVALTAACGSDTPSVGGTLPPIEVTTTTTTLPETTTTLPDSYRVQAGDTLMKIATRFGVDANELMALNGITNPDHIEIGQKLKLPRPHVVADTLPPTSPPPVTA